MKTINNEAQLISELSNVLADVISEILDKCKEELQKQIDADGIGAGRGSFYEPTGEFREAWTINAIEKIGNQIFGTMEYDASKIATVEPDNFIHGSNYYSGGSDASQFLPDLIFGGQSGLIFGEGFWTLPRDAWGETIDIIRTKINQWFQEGMAKRGLFVMQGYGLNIS